MCELNNTKTLEYLSLIDEPFSLEESKSSRLAMAVAASVVAVVSLSSSFFSLPFASLHCSVVGLLVLLLG